LSEKKSNKPKNSANHGKKDCDGGKVNLKRDAGGPREEPCLLGPKIVKAC